jgi:cytoskeleton protein RodZ
VPYFGEDESGARKLSVTGNEQLRFEFAADCWIEIRGADDALLYADLGRAGQVRRFVGVGPFKLKIGFAEGVKLFFDAQEVDLAPHTRNQMARLELGQ